MPEICVHPFYKNQLEHYKNQLCWGPKCLVVEEALFNIFGFSLLTKLTYFDHLITIMRVFPSSW